mmetsp:Transcript_1739/g.1661  ORF Transcript_1739/g.1661 Transcript_1739/m.1661 type:complete len:169 (+) Transcript_1739:6-512(+)
MEGDESDGQMMGEESQMRQLAEMYGMEMDEMGDMEDMDGDMYGQEMDEDMDEEEKRQMMGDSYGMEGSPGEEDYHEGDGSINFEENPAFSNLPPLDRMRKIRRDILRSVNEYRENYGSTMVYNDPLSNRAATEYAEYLLENSESQADLDGICERNFLVGEVMALVGEA